MKLEDLSVPDAKLVQIALKQLGIYGGTTFGKPGAKTVAAYNKYLASFDAINPKTDSPNELPALLVKILKAEEGVKEVGGNNTGKRVREYQAATWLDGTGWPWCAAFVCWGIREASKKMALPFERPRTAGAWDFENWATDQKLKLYKPRRGIKAGDIVIYDFSHIGVAIADESRGYVATIEGNTDGAGSREGGGVYEKKRKTSSIRSHIRLETKV